MKNALTKPGGHAWRHFFMACSKLEAMAIYVVKQACGNEIMPSMYLIFIDFGESLTKTITGNRLIRN